MDKKQIIRRLLLWSGILFFLLFVGSGIVVSPFIGDINVIDEGQFGAWFIHLRQGDYLYKDVYAAYGPLYIYPIYLASKFFVPSVFIIRLIYITGNVFLAVVIALGILRRLKISFPLQLLSLGMLIIVPGYVMRQGIGLLGLLCLLYSLEKNRTLFSFVAGAVLSLCFLVSIEIGIFIAIIYGVLFFYNIVVSKKTNEMLKKTVALLAGFFIVSGLFFSWSNSEGWFSFYIHSVFDDLSVYSSINLPNGKSFPNVIEQFPFSYSPLVWVKFLVSKDMLLYWVFFFYVITFFYLFVRFILKKNNSKLVFLLFLYGLFLSMILIGRSGHFSFVLPPVFILFSYFLQVLIGTFTGTKDKTTKVISSFLIFLLLSFSLRTVLIYRPHFSKILDVPSAVFSEKNNPDHIGHVAISEEQKESVKTIQDFLKKKTKQKENVFFLSNSPMMYFLTDRNNATSYDLPEVANTKEKRYRLLSELREDQTRYIIEDTTAWDVDGISNRRRLPEVMKYIKENYNVTKLKNYIIYVKK